jgi:hypothetical protein
MVRPYFGRPAVVIHRYFVRPSPHLSSGAGVARTPDGGTALVPKPNHTIHVPSDKLPWFPFYGRDFFCDETVKTFTARQIGFYTYLLWNQWEHGSIPDLDACLCFPLIRSALYDEEMEISRQNLLMSGPGQSMPYTVRNEVKCILLGCFLKHPTLKNRFVNPRLEQIKRDQEEERLINQQRGKKSWESRRNGHHVSTISSPDGDHVVGEANQSQSQSQNQKEEKKKTRARSKKLSDEEWLTQLRTDPAYQHVDFDHEWGKMDRWLRLPEHRGRERTRQFVLNWLDKIPRPLKAVLAKTCQTRVQRDLRLVACDQPAVAMIGTRPVCAEHQQGGTHARERTATPSA